MAMKNRDSSQERAQYISEALELYERYGKPLETAHAGEYLAVSPTGKTVIGPDLLSVTKEAAESFGPGNIVFKIGDIAVGKWL
jgi:hypothetical protein